MFCVSNSMSILVTIYMNVLRYSCVLPLLNLHVCMYARIVLKSPMGAGGDMSSYDMGAGGDKSDSTSYGTGGPSAFKIDGRCII